jgi:hypothetical protein
LALWVSKLPVICPEPPVMACWMTGAVITWLSSTMAKRLPTFLEVMSPKVMAPRVSNLKVTTEREVC